MPISGKNNQWTFSRSYKYTQTHVMALTFYDDGSDDPQDITQVLFFKPNGLFSNMLKWQAVAMTSIENPEITVIIVGGNGNISEGTAKGFSEKIIDESDECPANRGILRDVRRIGDRAYACGMGRQVYRRETNGTWTRFDNGVVTALDSGELAGFNSIDGFSEDDIYAVGWRGEIWHCEKGKWEQLDSPTNLKLERVVCAGDGQVYAVGQAGVIIRGRGHSWEIVAQSDTKEQFWGAAWFLNRLWLATNKLVFVLEEGDVLRPVPLISPSKGKGKKEDAVSCGWLDAGFGSLWSVGPKHVFKTVDGETWEQVFTA